MKWILFDFLTGETKGEFPLSEDQVSIDVNNTDTGTLTIPAYFLSESERNNFSTEKFQAYSRGVVLAKDDEEWDSPTALLTAGVITKWSYSLSTESYVITFESPYQYLLKIGPYSSALWNEEEDPGADISFEADTWGGLMWKILQYSLLGDDITSPPAGFNTPQIFVSDATTSGTGMGWVEYASQMNSVASIWEQIRDGENSKGEEFRFIPEWTDSNQDTVQIKVEFGTGLAPHINFNTGDPYVLDPQNTGAEWEVSELTLDNDYTFVANKWVVAGEVVKQDNSLSTTTLPTLVEFDSLGDAVLEASVDARLVERMKNNEKPAVVGSLTIVGDHDFETLSLLGRFIQIQATQKSIGVYASLRVISASWTSVDGQNVITYELMQPSPRYPKLISKLVQTGDANNDPSFVFGGFDFPDIETPTTPTIPDIPPYTPPVPPRHDNLNLALRGILNEHQVQNLNNSNDTYLVPEILSSFSLAKIGGINNSIRLRTRKPATIITQDSGLDSERITQTTGNSDFFYDLPTSVIHASVLMTYGNSISYYNVSYNGTTTATSVGISTVKTNSNYFFNAYFSYKNYLYLKFNYVEPGVLQNSGLITLESWVAIELDPDTAEVLDVNPIPAPGINLRNPNFLKLADSGNQIFGQITGFEGEGSKFHMVTPPWSTRVIPAQFTGGGGSVASGWYADYFSGINSSRSSSLITAIEENNVFAGMDADMANPMNPVWSKGSMHKDLGNAGRTIYFHSSTQTGLTATTGGGYVVNSQEVIVPFGSYVGNYDVQTLFDEHDNVFVLKRGNSTTYNLLKSVYGLTDDETFQVVKKREGWGSLTVSKKGNLGWLKPRVWKQDMESTIAEIFKLTPATWVSGWGEDYEFANYFFNALAMDSNFVFDSLKLNLKASIGETGSVWFIPWVLPTSANATQNSWRPRNWIFVKNENCWANLRVSTGGNGSAYMIFAEKDPKYSYVSGPYNYPNPSNSTFIKGSDGAWMTVNPKNGVHYSGNNSAIGHRLIKVGEEHTYKTWEDVNCRVPEANNFRPWVGVAEGKLWTWFSDSKTSATASTTPVEVAGSEAIGGWKWVWVQNEWYFASTTAGDLYGWTNSIPLTKFTLSEPITYLAASAFYIGATTGAVYRLNTTTFTDSLINNESNWTSIFVLNSSGVHLRLIDSDQEAIYKMSLGGSVSVWDDDEPDEYIMLSGSRQDPNPAGGFMIACTSQKIWRGAFATNPPGFFRPNANEIDDSDEFTGVYATVNGNYHSAGFYSVASGNVFAFGNGEDGHLVTPRQLSSF